MFPGCRYKLLKVDKFGRSQFRARMEKVLKDRDPEGYTQCIDLLESLLNLDPAKRLNACQAAAVSTVLVLGLAGLLWG